MLAEREGRTLAHCLPSPHPDVLCLPQACGASNKVKSYFEDEGIPYYALELDTRADGEALRGALAEQSGSDKTPAVYIRGQLVGGYDVGKAYKTGELSHWTNG